MAAVAQQLIVIHGSKHSFRVAYDDVRRAARCPVDARVYARLHRGATAPAKRNARERRAFLDASSSLSGRGGRLGKNRLALEVIQRLVDLEIVLGHDLAGL